MLPDQEWLLSIYSYLLKLRAGFDWVFLPTGFLDILEIVIVSRYGFE